MTLKGWDTEFTDLLPTSPFGVCCSFCCIVINFILIVLFFPCTVTQLGQYKLGLVRNKVTGFVDLENSHEPGRYWIGFWKEFIEFPSTLNTIEFSDEKPEKGVQHLSVLRSRDKDGKEIRVDISIQYLLTKDKIGRIYKDMLVGYEDIYISELRDVLAKAANLFKIEDVWLDYTKVVNVMRARCLEVLANRNAFCWGLQVWGITLTSKFENKLVLTQVRKQAQKTEIAKKTQTEVRAKTQVLLAEYRKNVTILKSGGDAQKYNIERAAFAMAQSNIIEAQSQALQIIKDKVCPDYASWPTMEGANTTCNMPGWVMDADQLVSYAKMVLLKGHNASHLIYNLKGGLHPKAMNVQASRNIMHGRARRLREGEAAPQHNPHKGSDVDLDHEL